MVAEPPPPWLLEMVRKKAWDVPRGSVELLLTIAVLVWKCPAEHMERDGDMVLRDHTDAMRLQESQSSNWLGRAWS